MPLFKYEKICKKMICIFGVAVIALGLVATILGTYFGSLFGAVIGWIYSMVIVWFIMDHYGYLLDSDNVKKIRNNIKEFENLEISSKGALQIEPISSDS